MSKKLVSEQIQYVEFSSPDLAAIQAFYETAFGWEFTSYGPDYTAFTGTYIDGGFTTGTVTAGSILIILYAEHLESTQERITTASGTITKPIFSFPGGRRFHFRDPDGNELAVWTDK